MLKSHCAETSMQDVAYNPGQVASTINPDDPLNLRLPSSIGEVRFDIRVAGASQIQSFGSLTLTTSTRPRRPSR
ncbi:hypothetical protein J7302_19275 [Pseudomonas sp. DB1]|uniref:Uncharacterized protein n=1 Tax=Metapseudomonas boanensis TaxID=2822138 RepID=A0ABS5XKM7_9GAMM|nr:hypothetical protein [Pseudomonas boanensis]